MNYLVGTIESLDMKQFEHWFGGLTWVRVPLVPEGYQREYILELGGIEHCFRLKVHLCVIHLNSSKMLLSGRWSFYLSIKFTRVSIKVDTWEHPIEYHF